MVGRRRRQFSPPPPPLLEDFCNGLRSAGNCYGLWPRFYDAQAPNGQFRVETHLAECTRGDEY